MLEIFPRTCKLHLCLEETHQSTCVRIFDDTQCGKDMSHKWELHCDQTDSSRQQTYQAVFDKVRMGVQLIVYVLRDEGADGK